MCLWTVVHPDHACQAPPAVAQAAQTEAWLLRRNPAPPRSGVAPRLSTVQGPLHDVLAGISSGTSGLLVLLAVTSDADEQARAAAAVAQALGLEGARWLTPHAGGEGADSPGSIASAAADGGGPTLVCLDAERVGAVLHECLGTAPDRVHWARRPGTLSVLQFEGRSGGARPVVHCANCIPQGRDA